MKKSMCGILLGGAMGIVNIVPMILQKLSTDILISNLIIWFVSGFCISISNLKIRYIYQGILLSILISAPSMVYIARASMAGVIWTLIWTVLSGLVLGGAFQKCVNELKG